jgi:pyrroline-5-carboxylate reductase
MKVSFIGGGNMAGSLISGLLGKGFSTRDIGAVEIREAVRKRLAEKHGISVYPGMSDQAMRADILVLAVKPQQLKAVCMELAGKLNEQTVLSIAAGIRSTDISRWLNGYGRIVRAMPNTPALIGAGITGLYASTGVSEKERAAAEAVLKAVGETIWLKTESEVDAVTAVSGSGPAYVFYFIEALQAAARELGLEDAAARRLALHTFHGAGRLALESTEDAATLRAQVTSPGGTTQAAILHMEEQEMKRLFVNAVQAAAKRAKELADEFGKC